MPDTHDYPLAQALGTGNLTHHARPAALPGRIETRCGQEGERTNRDGSFWCPDCLAMERAEAGTRDEHSAFQADLDRHLENPKFRAAYVEQTLRIQAAGDERGGDAVAVCSTPCDPDCDAVCHEDHVAGHKKQHWPYDCPAADKYFDEYFWGADEFVAEVIKRLRAERNAATARAEKAEIRLAERHPIRAEWSTQNTYLHPSDDVISQELAARRVAAHPDIHTAVLRRQLYAGPWVPAAEACRSCGEAEGIHGDPPRCSNCAVYGGAWSVQRPDASLDGLRGPFTGLLGPLGLAADAVQDVLDATETGGDGAECPNPNIDGICRHLTCGRCKQHTGDSHQGHYWAWCKVTNTKREFHFCCPGDCELEPPNIRHDDTMENSSE